MDDNSNQNPASNNGQPPASPPAQNPPANQSPQADSVKMAEELGKLKKENEALKDYQTRVDPVIQTIWSNQEVLNKVTEVHNKRLGITPEDSEDNDPKDNPPSVPQVPKDNDTKNWAVSQIVNDFYNKYGLDKAKPEVKQELDQKVGMMLREMLDPKGNKTLPQIMEDVPLEKLPQFLDHAYFLATKDQQLEVAKEQGKREFQQENVGIIGSMPSTTVNTDEVVLTAQEKEIIRKAGWSEEAYLKNKKEIAQRNNQLY